MSNYAKGMLGPKVTEKSKRAPTPKEGIEKDRKAATLRADRSDKIPAVHLSQEQHHHTLLRRCR